ncbi:MAG: DUF86 domain-containing protein [Epsilonproteobacteria bacterium]|nr:DUF86 domain-containing protein [Campylobacterota bacterium]
MSKKARDIELFIVDIFVALEKIKLYTGDFKTADSFRHSSLHWDATIRQLEILGEALNHLLNDKNFSSNAPKYFRKIVNFRNVIVHEYFGINEEEVWDVVIRKLGVFKEDLIVLVEEIDISSAVLSVQNEIEDEDIKKMLKELNV